MGCKYDMWACVEALFLEGECFPFVGMSDSRGLSETRSCIKHNNNNTNTRVLCVKLVCGNIFIMSFSYY